MKQFLLESKLLTIATWSWLNELLYKFFNWCSPKCAACKVHVCSSLHDIVTKLCTKQTRYICIANLAHYWKLATRIKMLVLMYIYYRLLLVETHWSTKLWQIGIKRRACKHPFAWALSYSSPPDNLIAWSIAYMACSKLIVATESLWWKFMQNLWNSHACRNCYYIYSYRYYDCMKLHGVNLLRGLILRSNNVKMILFTDSHTHANV